MERNKPGIDKEPDRDQELIHSVQYGLMVSERNLTDKASQIHQAMVDNGFWADGVDLNSIAKALLLIHSEVTEAAEALRTAKRCTVTAGSELSLPGILNQIVAHTQDTAKFGEEMKEETHTRMWKMAFEDNVKETLEDEIADIIIRCLDLAGALDIDVHAHVLLKMEYNSMRAKAHGGKLF